MRQGWGGRPVRVEQAQGILVAALGVLAGHYGYEADVVVRRNRKGVRLMSAEGRVTAGRSTSPSKSEHPYPFNLCYCSICRKTGGAGGFAINLGRTFPSLKVDGEEHIRVYGARVGDTGDGPGLSPLERRFCGECGSMLWCWDPRWPNLVHPFASAIEPSSLCRLNART